MASEAHTVEKPRSGKEFRGDSHTQFLFSTIPALEATIRRILGDIVCTHLNDPTTQELSANFEPDTGQCRLFVDDGIGPMRPLDASLSPAAITTATRMLATIDGQSLHPSAPFLSVTLAGGFRWHSVLDPSADGPSFSIRAHPRLIRNLSDFMTVPQQEFIKTAIATHQTILVSGSTSTG